MITHGFCLGQALCSLRLCYITLTAILRCGPLLISKCQKSHLEISQTDVRQWRLRADSHLYR